MLLEEKHTSGNQNRCTWTSNNQMLSWWTIFSKQTFKGSLSRDFRFHVFFTNRFPPGPCVSYCIGAFSNFYENSRRYLQLIASVSDTGDKLFTSVNDTGDILSVLLLPVINYQIFIITPTITVSPVTTIPAIIYRRYQQHRRWDTCNRISLPTPQSEHKVKNHYMSVNSNPTASQHLDTGD